MSGRVIKEGYMVKSPPLDQIFAKWKRRYFRLYESGRLDYYEHEHAAQSAKGIINLLDCSMIEAIENFPGRSNCMRLITPQRTFILQCSSMNDLRMWREKIAYTRDNALGLTANALEQSITSTSSGGSAGYDQTDGKPDHNGLPPVATVGQPSSTDLSKPSYVNVPSERPSESGFSNSDSSTRQPRTYAPDPTTRKSYYVPGSSTESEFGGRKVSRQKTFAGPSLGLDMQPRRHRQSESNLDRGPRLGSSFDDMMVPSYSQRHASPLLPGRHVHPVSQSFNPARSNDLCEDAGPDAEGYVPMARTDEIVDDEYERMQVPAPPRATTPGKKPPRASSKPGKFGGSFQIPEEYEKWRDPSPTISNGPLARGQAPHRPTRLGTESVVAAPRPPTSPRPTVTPRGQSVR